VPRYNRGYTESMKTAVSLPEDLFRRAEIAAKRLRKSRSELYADALAKYLERYQTETITER
jgi:metal-responsive CopG/Arc/MetJ family transcriptional regulator